MVLGVPPADSPLGAVRAYLATVGLRCTRITPTDEVTEFEVEFPPEWGFVSYNCPYHWRSDACDLRQETDTDQKS